MPLDAGLSGAADTCVSHRWEDACLPERLTSAARVLSGAGSMRAVQWEAAQQGVFASRRHALVAAPTNSGKTVVGYLLLVEALLRGQRAVLLEPLRALAQEKADELRSALPALREALGIDLQVTLSTGDYRLEGDRFGDAAPSGELIVATPERLEAILRLPESEAWLNGVGAVCVDEVHMLGDAHRGGTLEFLITSLLSRPAPPRLALLSASINPTPELTRWLHPCDVIRQAQRTPPLQKWLVDLDEAADPTQAAAQWLANALKEEGAQALVFIHQARQAAGVAQSLTQALGEACGALGAMAYHSQMSPAQRMSVRQAFVAGDCRVVVATSALAMGVNLPATHVVVRDLTFIGARSPGVSELLQMAGRAGRGDRAGQALIIKRPTDRWGTEELLEALRSERLPDLVSSFSSASTRSKSTSPMAAEPVASLLARAGSAGMTENDLARFFESSLGGQALGFQMLPSLQWLSQRTLVYQDPADQAYRLTRLGEGTVRAVLPLSLGAGFGQLLRDLLSLEEDSETLSRWSPLDFLVALELLHDGTPSTRRFSAALVGVVTTWCEGHSQLVPMLYRRWLRGERAHSCAAEVLGSLGVEPQEPVNDRDEWARQRGYVAMFNAIVLYERSLGRRIGDLERQFGVANLAGIEERWRDTMLWLLSGLTRLLDVKVVFFHLKEHCHASPERIQHVKRSLGAMRHQALELMEQLKWASPLGSMLLSMRRRCGGSLGIGERSIRLLEASGAISAAQVAGMSVSDMVQMGIKPEIARRLQVQAKRMLV